MTTSAQLSRHDQRRRQGIPTLSLLVGPPGLGARAWRAWAASQDRAIAECQVTDERDVLRAWIVAAAERHDLVARAAGTAGERAGIASSELLQRLVQPHSAERALLVERVTDGLVPHLARVCRLLLSDVGSVPERSPARVAERLFGGETRPGWATLDAITRLLPLHAEPAVLFAPREALPPRVWLRGVAAIAAALLEELPGLPVAIAADAALTDLPDSRAKALLHEGTIVLPSLGTTDIEAILAARGVSPERVPASSIAQLAADGADEELIALYADAAAGTGDAARSKAERFLHARLESLPWAAGHFALNGSPGFRFGRREAEVDLLAGEIGIAIEIDGYYHFQDHEAYRRDRRKDVELQRHGYLVLRFLEEDIVADLERILGTIREAVEHRTTTPQGKP